MPKTPEKPGNARSPWKTALIILLVLFLAANLFAFLISGVSGGEPLSGNVAHIEIKGEIVGDSSSGLFSGSSGVGASDVVELLDEAKEDPEVKGVLLEINSPGGSAVASAEIAQAVMEVREANKTVVAWIREEGASGAYWIATASDHIVAHPLSITGSVGVFSSYLEFSGLLNRFNVTYERLVAGTYKDMGSPYRKLTAQETLLFQQKLDLVQDSFAGQVASARNLTPIQTQEIKSGIFYLGSEAFDLGLVDELGGKKEAVEFLEMTLNETVELKSLRISHSIFDMLNNVMNEKAFYMGRGISTGFMTDAKAQTGIQARR